MALKVNIVMRTGKIMSRAVVVVQQKMHKPVHFEITEQSRDSLLDLINEKQLSYRDYLFKSRLASSEHLSTRQYAHTVKKLLKSIGLEPVEYEIIPGRMSDQPRNPDTPNILLYLIPESSKNDHSEWLVSY